MTFMEALEAWSRTERELLHLAELESGRDGLVRYAADVHAISVRREELRAERRALKAVIEC